MFGFSLDWTKQKPLDAQSTLGGISPAMVAAFIKIDSSSDVPFDFEMLLWHGYVNFSLICRKEAQRVSAYLELTIEPTRAPTEISTIPLTLLSKIADHCYKINTEYGTPILLRFGHEMNGDWTYYGMMPSEFVLGFQRMANIIHVLSMIYSKL